MGFVRRLVLALLTIAIAGVYKVYNDLSKPLPRPNNIEFFEYWGEGDGVNYKEDMTVRPFNISYSNEVIDKLRTKLKDVPTLVPPLEGTAFQYGFNSDALRNILEYWRTTYLDKWDEREAYLNKYKHFKTQIQGLDIHFMHIKSDKVKNPKRIAPLLMLHGWPGSVREFYEIIPMLNAWSDDKQYVFEVIVPSLPGYGWSQGTTKPGLSPAKVAIMMKNLMSRLGFKKFYVQGGDWGAIIGNLMATFFEKDILGVHLNMCMTTGTLPMVKNALTSLVPSYFIEAEHRDFYPTFLSNMKDIIEEMGYAHLHATKPDTIGTALVGNPVGLAAYILEKFSTWTNKANRNLPDGGLTEYFTLDSLLDNVMIYYLTDSILTSQRLYAEQLNIGELSKEYDRIRTKTPAACAKFKHDLGHQADWVLKDHFTNLLQSNHYNEGGHFAAMQLPEVLYKDIVEFVNRLYVR